MRLYGSKCGRIVWQYGKVGISVKEQGKNIKGL